MPDNARPPLAEAPAQSLHPGANSAALRLPVVAFTASLLFDVMALIAPDEAQARIDRYRATELLTLGLGEVLASIALELADDLGDPPADERRALTRRLSLHGAVIAVYLLDVAVRREARPPSALARDAVPVGLSLAGLTLASVAFARRPL